MKNANVDVGRPPLRLALDEAASFGDRAADFFSLTKPRLNFLVVVTATVGYYLGAGDNLHLLPLLEAVAGTALVAGGAAGLNQVSERATDSLMWRTRTRPLPARRISPADATIFSAGLAAIGLLVLALTANFVAAAVALVTLLAYNVVYTPLKQRSSLATFVGAVPGALPPMIGWAAARGALTIDAWVLFGIVFLCRFAFHGDCVMYRTIFTGPDSPCCPSSSQTDEAASHAVFFAGCWFQRASRPF